MQIRSHHPLVEILQWCPRIPRSVAWALDKVYLLSTWSGNSQSLSSSPVWGLHTCCSLGPEGWSSPVLPAPILWFFRSEIQIAPCCPHLPMLSCPTCPQHTLPETLSKVVSGYISVLGITQSQRDMSPTKSRHCFAGSWMVGLSTLLGTRYPMRQVLPSLCSTCNSQVRERSSRFHNITRRHSVTSGLGQRHSSFPPTAMEVVREQDGPGRCTLMDIGQGENATKVNFQVELKSWLRILEGASEETLRTIAYD